MITTTTFLAGASHRIKELAIDRRDELVKLAPRTVALVRAKKGRPLQAYAARSLFLHFEVACTQFCIYSRLTL